MKKVRFLFVLLALTVVFSVCAFADGEEARDVSYENTLATDLKALGLFSGVSENNFDLERIPTRTEVLVMLIRVLGEEKTALSGEWEHPFTDVPEWADKYVGYAYENGLTKGVSATKFGTDNATSTTYLTFMLRALGYSDADGDFAWDNPHTLAKRLGLLPSFTDTENFLRADIVIVSYAALSQNLKESTATLAEKLIEKEVFTAEVFAKNYRGARLTDKENEGKTALDATALYEKCAPGVAFINAYDEDGNSHFVGSGFFIDESGILVTTFHTFSGATRLEVTIPGSETKYNVSGVYAYSAQYDWMVFKVDGSGFTALPINCMPLKGASTVYTIGAPMENLENTVSEGLVSNTRRVNGDYVNFQFNASVSYGSIGGPVINSFGEVIGIVQDMEYEGQNLNYALPISAIATAELDSVTPYADCDFNSAWYYLDTDEITVKVGEAANFKFDYDYAIDYDKADDLYFKPIPEDNSIASAIEGVEYDFYSSAIRVVGNKVGSTKVTVYNQVTKDTFTFNVNVVENPDITAPKVTYNSTMEEIRLHPGAMKFAVVDIVEYGLSDSPDGMLAAEYTVKCSNSKIDFQYDIATLESDDEYVVAFPEYEGKAMPYILLSVSYNRAVKAEITISNNKTGDTLVIPVIIGDRYESAHKELAEGIMASELVEHRTGDNPEDEGYVYEMSVMGVTERIAYYPASGDIVFYAGGPVQQGATMDYSLVLEKDGTISYDVGMSMQGLNIRAAGDIDKPETFFADMGTFKHDKFECPELYKKEMEPQMTMLVAALVYSLDDSGIPMFCENLDMSDFGFVDIDLSSIMG